MNHVEKILAKLEDKMVKDVGYRSDMYVADFISASKSHGKLLIGYDKTLGHVNGDDVRKFVVRNFGGKLIPNMKSCVLHKDDGAVSVIVSMNLPTRKYSDRNKMVAISSTMFLDEELGDAWEVKEVDGTKFLEQVCREDIDAIVTNRRNRMALKGSRLTFASVKDGIPAVLSPGDIISYHYKGEVCEGKVESSDGNVVKVRTKNYPVRVISVTDVIRLVEVNPGKIKRELYDYYKTIWGPDMAKDLTDPIK